MDPSIMKLLEEDEDETMHSGAEVEAFQAALDRDLRGDSPITSQPSESTSGVMPPGSNNTSSLSLPQMQAASQNDGADSQTQSDVKFVQQEQRSSQMELEQHASVVENQQVHNDVHLALQKQDDRQLRPAEQVANQAPQTTGLPVSEKSPVFVREQERMHNRDGESQYLKLQKMSNQQAMMSERANNPANNPNNRGKQVPFALLLPVLLPQLDKDRAMQLQTLFNKLKRNELSKDDFVRLMRSVVGDQMLKLAVCKVQSQSASNLPSAQQLPSRMPPVSTGSTNFNDLRSFAQAHQKGINSPSVPSHHTSAAQGQTDSSYVTMENNAQSSREAERQLDSNGSHLSSNPATVNQEKQLHFQQKPFTTYGGIGNNYHPSLGTNANTSTSSVKPQPHETQMRQTPQHQSMVSSRLGGDMPSVNMVNPNFDRQTSMSDPKRLQAGSLSHFANNLTSQQSSIPWQSSTNKEQSSGPLSSIAYVKQEPVDQAAEQNRIRLSNSQGLSSISTVQAFERGNVTPGTSKDESLEKQSSKTGFPTNLGVPPTSGSISSSTNATSHLDPNTVFSSRIPSAAAASGINSRTPPKKPSIGQKKQLEAVGSSPPPSSKKQKVSGAFSDQSIEQLNDVTAVSGVNIREEEEQLFSGAKEDSRVSEASRRVVQEEEERLILQKTPLQKKLAEIMVKCGLKSISSDVEKCLSLCVEERLRGLISNLIRVSKQRVDSEKPRHRTLITSDVRQQIMTMNQIAKEEWEKKQAEIEKLRKQNDPEDSNGVASDKEKDEGRAKSVKANREQDDKMRATAANVAARAAVGGDDMLSKWQLMAEQARQKREGGGMDGASSSQPIKDGVRKPSLSGRNLNDNLEADKRGTGVLVAPSGAFRKSGKNQAMLPHSVIDRSISVRDVIAVLEREPQMSKSTIIYRLFEKTRSDSTGELQ